MIIWHGISVRKGKMSTISKISFGESSFKNQNLSERHRKRPILSGIACMTDEEIVKASVRNANKEAEDSKAARVLKSGPLMFLAATTVAYGAVTKGKLSDKVASTALALGLTAVASAVFKPVNTVVDAVMNSTSKDKEEKQSEKHPVINLAANALAIGVATFAAVKGIQKGKDVLASKFAPSAEAIKEVVSKKADMLDSSKLGKLTEKASSKFGKFASNHPKLASVVKGAGLIVPGAAIFGGTMSLANKVVDDRNQKAVSNINKLMLCREYAQAALECNPFSDSKKALDKEV